MIDKKIKYSIVLILLFPVLLIAEDKLTLLGKWSQYQGKKTWQEAKEHCQTMKMRLPTISELSKANDDGTSINWRKNGYRFWSVNKNLESNNSTYMAISLLESEDKKNKEVHKGESQLGVFCLNSTEESVGQKEVIELEEKYPPYYTTKYKLIFSRIQRDNKMYYISNPIGREELRDFIGFENWSDSWYFARDFAEKLNKEENCKNCYRLPYEKEVKNDKGISSWLITWNFKTFGFIINHLILLYPLDYIHDIISHPLTWQSYIYPLSPDRNNSIGNGIGRTLGMEYEKFFLVRPIDSEDSIDLIKIKRDIVVSKFSEYQGKMQLHSANDICKSLKMRLPTINELMEAYDLNITDSWEKDGSIYWSSTSSSYLNERFKVDNATKDYGPYREDNGGVRCIR
jgi:hypothetical protein